MQNVEGEVVPGQAVERDGVLSQPFQVLVGEIVAGKAGSWIANRGRQAKYREARLKRCSRYTSPDTRFPV